MPKHETRYLLIVSLKLCTVLTPCRKRMPQTRSQKTRKRRRMRSQRCLLLNASGNLKRS
jgi:cytochrome c biogenesis protein ResB